MTTFLAAFLLTFETVSNVTRNMVLISSIDAPFWYLRCLGHLIIHDFRHHSCFRYLFVIVQHSMGTNWNTHHFCLPNMVVNKLFVSPLLVAILTKGKKAFRILIALTITQVSQLLLWHDYRDTPSTQCLDTIVIE